MFIASLAVMLGIMPRADHQSYNFELNQPWKYPLLTAEFDTPVLRDTTSMREMRDSINKNFVPFVKQNDVVETENLERFAEVVADSVPTADASILLNLLANVYQRGIMETSLGMSVRKMASQKVREIDENDATQVRTVDASEMLTAGDAYDYIDSA